MSIANAVRTRARSLVRMAIHLTDSTSGSILLGRSTCSAALKRAIQASEAELIAEEYSLQDVQQTLVADVASSYLNIRLLQNQIEIVEKSLQLQEATTTVVNGRAKAGVATKLDSEQTTAFFHRTRADKAALELQLDVEFNRLSILLGESPATPLREFVGVGAIPDTPYLPAAGIPADLLRRRPDVRQAEAVVSAASARIGIAEADLYPTLTLLGTVGVSAQNVSSLFETDSLLFSVGPSFTWNILSFGRIKNNVEIHESLMRQAAGGYRVAVLEAVQEVEDSMARYEGLRKQLDALESALQSDAKAVELSLQRYEMGKSNFQRVLDVQVQLLEDSQAVAAARANANIQLIKLYKAVGGGWPLQAADSGGGCAECVECATGHQEAGMDCWSSEQSVNSNSVQGGNSHLDHAQPSIQVQEVQQTGTMGSGLDVMQPANSQMVAPPQPNSHSILETEGFEPIQLGPDVGQIRQPIPSVAADETVLAEMFDWDKEDAAVVKSMSLKPSPIASAADAGYFAESPQADNKRNTQKASSTGPAPVVWDSKAVKVD